MSLNDIILSILISLPFLALTVFELYNCYKHNKKSKTPIVKENTMSNNIHYQPISQYILSTMLLFLKEELFDEDIQYHLSDGTIFKEYKKAQPKIGALYTWHEPATSPYYHSTGFMQNRYVQDPFFDEDANTITIKTKDNNVVKINPKHIVFTEITKIPSAVKNIIYDDRTEDHKKQDYLHEPFKSMISQRK